MIKKLAVVFGVILLVVGVLGFVPALAPDGKLLSLFLVDPLHNIVHLVTGALGLYAGMASSKTAKMYFQIFGVVYALVAVLGFMVGDGKILGVLVVNAFDNYLHVLIAVVALYAGFAIQEEVEEEVV